MFADGDALVGDAVANLLQWAGTRYRVVTLFDLDRYYDSWLKADRRRGYAHLPRTRGAPFPAVRLKENLPAPS
ncbi:MAG: hypothetical protein ACLPN5_11335 [Roseiarcus sp.]